MEVEIGGVDDEDCEPIECGEETVFKRENNVYRMRVKHNEAGFQRQG